MKIKSALIFTLIIGLSATAFGQKTESAKPETAKAPAASVKLPTTKEVLDRYVKALGGREAMEKLKSRTATGTVELVPMNLKGTFEAFSAPEAKSHTKMTLVGIGDLVETTDGKAAWSVNPIQGNRDRTGGELIQSKLTNDFYRDIRLEKLFPKMELKGAEKVGEAETYVIVATPDGGVPSETWYFDAKSGLLLRADTTALSPDGSQAMSTYYEDYRAVDGVMLPHRIRSKTPQFEIVIVNTEIKHNVPVDEAKFTKPKS